MKTRVQQLFRLVTSVALALALAPLATSKAMAEGPQVVRFRLEPFCNKVSLAVAPSSAPTIIGVFGYDDNCGDAPQLPIYGTAVVNPDGGISLGVTTSIPSSQCECVAIQTNVQFPPNSNSGVWTDDKGQSGDFVFDILDQPSG
jgi:hypothetical protein